MALAPTVKRSGGQPIILRHFTNNFTAYKRILRDQYRPIPTSRPPSSPSSSLCTSFRTSSSMSATSSMSRCPRSPRVPSPLISRRCVFKESVSRRRRLRLSPCITHRRDVLLRRNQPQRISLYRRLASHSHARSYHHVPSALADQPKSVRNALHRRANPVKKRGFFFAQQETAQPVPRGKIVSIPVIDPHFCVHDESGRILPFQLTPDFETPFFLSFEASLPAGSSRVYQLRRCNAPLDALARRVPRDSSREQRFGTAEFGLLVSPAGILRGVEVGGSVVEFGATLGFFVGSDKRTVRSGL